MKAKRPPVWITPWPHRVEWDHNRMVTGVPYKVTVPRHGVFTVRRLGELTEVRKA